MYSAHAQQHHTTDKSKLVVALAVTTALLFAEAIGGFASHSLALIADAAHMLTDVAAAGLALWAATLAARPPDRSRTFGYGRSTVVAALANAAALFVIVVFIGLEALSRLRSPQPVGSTVMLIVASAALLANLVLSWFLTRGKSESLNVRSVTAHVLGDAAISAGVIVAAVVILFTGATIVDPIVSLLAALTVAYSAWGLVRESLNVLMEGVPAGINISEIEAALCQTPPIDAVHDLHVWCLTDQRLAASLHVRVHEIALAQSPAIVARIKNVLHDRFGIDHATVEVECQDCETAC